MTSQTDLPAELYLGEPKARDPFLAVFVTLLCPGLGSVYLGHLLRGVLICLTYVALVGAFVLAWSTMKFFPVLPLLVMAVGLTAVTVTLALKAGEEARRAGNGYLLRGANHPVVYVLVAVVFYMMPLAALGQFTANHLWSLVWVETEAMFPTLVRGDLLLVDRTAYRDVDPLAGDLVVIRHHGGRGPLRLGRIVGVPGDEVSVQDAVPYVDGRPLPRSVVSVLGSDPEVQLAALDDVTPPPGAVTVAEWRGEVTYLTAEMPMELGVVFEPTTLVEGEYFVLNDNRAHLGDSRDLGPVQRIDIMGKPLYVAYSSSPDDGVRWSRAARRIQPQPQPRLRPQPEPAAP